MSYRLSLLQPSRHRHVVISILIIIIIIIIIITTVVFVFRKMQAPHYQGILLCAIQISRAILQRLRKNASREEMVRSHSWLPQDKIVGMVQGRNQT